LNPLEETMRRISKVVVALFAISLFTVTDAMAQVVYAKLEGLVQDQSQAVIPGGSIAVTNSG
jgi:hypothetical protein